MSEIKLSKRDLHRAVRFIMYAPYGSVLYLRGQRIFKNFALEDLGFTYRKGRFYSYDPATGVGERVSKEYVMEIISDLAKYHPETLFSDLPAF